MNFSAAIRTQKQAARLYEQIAAAVEKGVALYVEITTAKKKRSLAQNALNWLWCDEARKWLWESGIGFRNARGEAIRPYTAEELHEWHKELFLPTTVVEIAGKVSRQRHSRKLNVQQFTDFLAQIDAFWAEQGLQLPQPEQTYQTAMGMREAA